MVRVAAVMKRNAATRRNAVRRTARAAASAPRRPATHFTFVCALRRLRPENILLIHTRQPIPRQKRFRTKGGRGDGA